MALDYVATSKKIVEAVGGVDNISSASHCMTRLRLVLKDNGKASDEKVQQIKGVKSVIKQGGQYQVVIGNEVSNLFKEFKKLGNWGEDGGGAPAKAEGSPVQRLFGFVSGCMTPMLPAMLGGGMLKVILTLLTTFAGMSTESSTYILLFSFADAFFMFLPIFLGFTISKKLGGNPMLFMLVGASLCYPDLVSLMGGSLELGVFLGMPCTYLFGLPVICATYTSSVLPMLLMAPVMKWAEDFADKVSPNVLKSFLKPLLFIVICIPCSLYVLGPIGNLLGNLLSNVFVAMYNAAPWLTVAVLSAIMPFIVMTGMHYALVPLMFNNLATIGYDVIVGITMFCSNIAQGGATFGVALKTKDEETRSEGIACGISACVAGVTEPALYGINLRFIKPMIGAVAGAGISGLFCGLTGVRCYVAGGSPSFLSLITFIGGEGNPMRGVIFGAIGGVMSVVISAVVSFILYKDPEKAPAAASSGSSAPASAPALADTIVVSPLTGEAVALTSIQDEVFSTETLGKGVAIEPSVGEVHAPCDGVISTFFDTGHAFGLVADTGVEFLIHVGMDTIKLGGKGFTPMAKEGDRVKKGQLLLKFDIDFIKSQGLPVTTPVVVSNTDDFSSVTALASGKVDLNTNLLEIKK